MDDSFSRLVEIVFGSGLTGVIVEFLVTKLSRTLDKISDKLDDLEKKIIVLEESLLSIEKLEPMIYEHEKFMNITDERLKYLKAKGGIN